MFIYPNDRYQVNIRKRCVCPPISWKVFGTKGITSEVFHGKRSISKTQAKKLAAYFYVGAELFI